MPGFSDGFEVSVFEHLEQADRKKEVDAIIEGQTPTVDTEQRSPAVLAGLGHIADLLEKTDTQPIPTIDTEENK